MLRRLSERLTYANVVATIALFLALGGLSYVKIMLPRNSVGKREIKTGGVGKAEAARNSVGRAELKTGAIDRSEVSGRLAASFVNALPQTVFVPKKSNDPCDTLGAPPGCQNVAGDTKSISFLDTKGWSINCPSGTQTR